MAIPRLTHDVCRLSFLHRDSHGLRRTLVAAVLLAGVTSIATAATTTYTSRSSFEASLPTGNFFNNFSGVPDATIAPVASVSGSGGTPAISYTIAAPTAGLGVFPDINPTKAIGNWNSSNNVVVDFTSGNVFSAGGNVWLTDINGNRQAGSVTLGPWSPPMQSTARVKNSLDDMLSIDTNTKARGYLECSIGPVFQASIRLLTCSSELGGHGKNRWG